MSINFYTLESKFQKAKIEYKTLIETLQTSCLGNKYGKECVRATKLNNELQNYLIEMQNYLVEIPSLVKSSTKKHKEYIDFSYQLNQDMLLLQKLKNETTNSIDRMTLLQQEKDSQVFASTNYGNVVSWFFVSITVVGLLLYKN